MSVTARLAARRKVALAALLTVVGCREEGPSSSPPEEVPTAASSQSAPGRCGRRAEVAVETVCGPAIACEEGGLPIALADDDGAWLARRCLATLQSVAGDLGEKLAPAEPSYGLVGPMDTTTGCARPGLGAQARAVTSVLEKVRRRGRALVGSPSEAAELDRFDFTEMRASCVGRGFLLELSSDSGAPGALPYHGIWRVTDEGQESLYELHDTQARERIWPAGDLDGDGLAELLVRRPVGELESEDPVVFGARYTLISVALAKPVEVLARARVVVALDGKETVEPSVIPMAVPSGAVLLIDDRPHRLEGDAIAARPKLRAEVEALRSSPGRLRAELLAGAPKDWSRGAACDDEARLRWARRVAPILGRALGKPDAVVPLAGLWACPDAWRL